MSKLITLRTGAQVHRAALVTTTLALQHLAENEPLALVDAVEWAHTGEPQSYSQKRLEALGLITSGEMHEVTRDVILAVTDGRDFEIRFVKP